MATVNSEPAWLLYVEPSESEGRYPAKLGMRCPSNRLSIEG